MATVHIRIGKVMGAGTPTYQKGGRTATITSSSSSQATTIAAEDGDFATICASGGNVRIAFLATALASSGEWVLDGQTRDFGPLNRGDTVSVIDMA